MPQYPWHGVFLLLFPLTSSALWPSGVVGWFEGVVVFAFDLEGVLRDVGVELHPVLALEGPFLRES